MKQAPAGLPPAPLIGWNFPDGFTKAAVMIPPSDLGGFFTSFVALYEKYAWCIPAATNSSPRRFALRVQPRPSAIAAVLCSNSLRAERRMTRVRATAAPAVTSSWLATSGGFRRL